MNEENELEFSLMGVDCDTVECTNIDCMSPGASTRGIPAKIERCYEPGFMGGDVIGTHCGCGYFN